MEDFYAGKFKGETPLATRNSLAIAANQAADNLNDAYNKALDSYTSYYETLQESPETQNYLEEYKKYERLVPKRIRKKNAGFSESRRLRTAAVGKWHGRRTTGGGSRRIYASIIRNPSSNKFR